jgi:DNA polymerase-3 subunit delta'
MGHEADRMTGHLPEVPKILRAFAKGLGRDRLAHAYILAGPAGTGKETLASHLGRFLVCEQPHLHTESPGPCGSCPGCTKANHGTHPDIVTVQPQGAMIKVGQIRDLQKVLSFSPLEGPRRACLVINAHRMNMEASNALLKTLEEPPRGTHLLLTATSPTSLLPTVASRCQVFYSGLMPRENLVTSLQVETGVDTETAQFLASAAEGSLERAKALASQDVLAARGRLLDLLRSTGNALPRMFLVSQEMSKDSDSLLLHTHMLRTLVRDLMIILGSDLHPPAELINADRSEDLFSLAERYTMEDIERYGRWLEQIEGFIDRNVNREFIAEAALIFWIRRHLAPKASADAP